MIAKIETLVCLGWFKNIFLLAQGWYSIRIYLEYSGKKRAMPRQHFELEDPDQEREPFVFGENCDYILNEAEKYCETVPFMIKYAGEDVCINHNFVFSVYVPWSDCSDSILHMELRYCSPEKLEEGSNSLSMVCERTILLSEVPTNALGEHKLCVWDEWHSCSIDTFVFSSVIAIDDEGPKRSILRRAWNSFTTPFSRRRGTLTPHHTRSTTEEISNWINRLDGIGTSSGRASPLIPSSKSIPDLGLPVLWENFIEKWRTSWSIFSEELKQKSESLETEVRQAFVSSTLGNLHGTYERNEHKPTGAYASHSPPSSPVIKAKPFDFDAKPRLISQWLRPAEQISTHPRVLVERFEGNIDGNDDIEDVQVDSVDIEFHSESEPDGDTVIQDSSRLNTKTATPMTGGVSRRNIKPHFRLIEGSRNRPGSVGLLSSRGRDKHFMIFVHGLDANRYDMQPLRNAFKQRWPYIRTCISTANEGNTHCSISDMGRRLAKEVLEFLQVTSSSYNCSRLSFIGHSLGVLIIRSALASSILRPYMSRLYLFVSVAGVHLGSIHSAWHIGTVSKIWQTFSKSQCLKQLSLSDHDDIEQTYLYRLSQSVRLSVFKWVLLASSPQDLYVPPGSARIEVDSICQRGGSAKSFSHLSMVSSLLGSMKPESIRRIEAIFHLPSSYNALIGRAAHLEMLENEPWLKILLDQVFETANDWSN